MTKYKTSYKRNLPHFHPEGEVFFVTYCLKEAISHPEMVELQEAFEIERKKLAGNKMKLDILNRQYFKKNG